MRKTLLITMDFLPDTGGVAIYWSELARYLTFNEFFILAPHSLETDEQNNIIRTNFFVSWLWPHWIALLIKLPGIIKKKNIETVIAGQILPVGTVCYLLKKIGLIHRYQVSCHGMDLAVLKGRKRKLAGRILDLADKVIVNSEYTRGLVNDLGKTGSEVYKVTPCPQNLLPTGANKAKGLVFKTENIILSVCRLVKRKGVDEVIKSMPLVWQSVPDVIYLIVGEGPDRERLKKVVDKYIGSKDIDKIIFTGRLNDDEKVSCYQSAKFLIMPTRENEGDIEGFGMVYLEAGLFSLPVIASPVGGVREVVKDGETGLFVDSKNTNEIAGAIVRLLNNDEYRRRLGINNHVWAKSFSWQDEAQKLIENL